MKLKDYIEKMEDWELTCWDSMVDCEFYMYKKDPVPDKDYPNVEKFMECLAEHLEVVEEQERGVVVNLYDLLNQPKMIDYAKEHLYESHQFNRDDMVVKLLFEDVLTNITAGYEVFSEKLVEAFGLLDVGRENEKSEVQSVDVIPKAEAAERVEKQTEEMIGEVEGLFENTPEGQIVDADTILVDLLEECDHEFSGFAQDIFNIWRESSDKKAVEQMFYEFTDMEFGDYLKKCKEETTRAVPEKGKNVDTLIKEGEARQYDGVSYVSANSLPAGWRWEKFDDGSGSLLGPNGEDYFSYDLAPYSSQGGIEYKQSTDQRYDVFWGGFSEFREFAESSVKERYFSLDAKIMRSKASQGTANREQVTGKVSRDATREL